MIEPIHLAWLVVPGAAAYRALVRDRTTGEAITLETDKPEVEVEPRLLDPTHVYEWRPQLRRRVDGEWENALPYLRLPAPSTPDGPTTTLRWSDDGAPAYRVVIRDDTLNAIVIKDGVQSTEYTVDWSRLDPSHRYRYRVQAFGGGDWENRTPYIPLNPPITQVGPTRSDRSRQP